MVIWTLRDFDIKSSFAFNQTVMSTLLLPPSSLLYRLEYNLFLYWFGYNLLYINISSFWRRDFMCFTKLRLSSLLDGRLARKNYLQISVFLNPIVIEQEKVPHALWKTTGEATSKVVRRRLTGRGQAWLLGCQYQLLPGLFVWLRPVFSIW